MNPFDRHTTQVPSKNSTSSFHATSHANANENVSRTSAPSSASTPKTIFNTTTTTSTDHSHKQRKMSVADFMNHQSIKSKTSSSSASFTTTSSSSNKKLYENTSSIQQLPYQPVSMQTIKNASSLKDTLRYVQQNNSTKEQPQKITKVKPFTPYNQSAMRPRMTQEKQVSLNEMKHDQTEPSMKQVDPKLSTEQIHVLDLILKQKQSVFFTGNAGRLHELYSI